MQISNAPSLRLGLGEKPTRFLDVRAARPSREVAGHALAMALGSVQRRLTRTVIERLPTARPFIRMSKEDALESWFELQKPGGRNGVPHE